MSKNSSYDIDLGSSSFVLARHSNGAPRIELGSYPDEPGPRGQIDTIRIDSLHEGYGQLMAINPYKYLDGAGADASIPNKIFWSAGSAEENLTLSASSTFDRGALFQYNGTLFVVNGNDIFTVDPSDDTITETNRLSAGAGNYFTGSWAIHGDFIYFGRAVEATHVSLACGRWQISTGIAGTWNVTGPVASYFYSFGNKIWYVDNTSTGPNAYWSDSSTGVLTPLRGPYSIKTTNNKVTWLHVLGPYAIYFLDNGTINGIDIDGVFAPIITESYGLQTTLDRYFGHGTKEWGGGLAIPHANGLLHLAANLSTVTEIGPYTSTNSAHSSEQRSTPSSVGVHGLEVHAGTLYASCSLNTFFTQQRQKPEWHTITSVDFRHNNCLGITRHATTGYRLFGFLDSVISFVNLAPPGHIAAAYGTPSPDFGVFSTRNFLSTSFYGAEAYNTKRFIRVRGHIQTDGNATYTLGFKTAPTASPSAAYTSLGDVSTYGYFSKDFPTTSSSLGRSCSVEIKLGAAWSDIDTHVNLPLFIDYYHVPSEIDFVRFSILASQHPIGAKGGTKRLKQTRESVISDIQSIIGTVVSLSMDDGNTDWTVLVEEYRAYDIADGIVLNSGESIVEVLCRRLA